MSPIAVVHQSSLAFPSDWLTIQKRRNHKIYCSPILKFVSRYPFNALTVQEQAKRAVHAFVDCCPSRHLSFHPILIPTTVWHLLDWHKSQRERDFSITIHRGWYDIRSGLQIMIQHGNCFPEKNSTTTTVEMWWKMSHSAQARFVCAAESAVFIQSQLIWYCDTALSSLPRTQSWSWYQKLWRHDDEILNYIEIEGFMIIEAIILMVSQRYCSLHTTCAHPGQQRHFCIVSS